LEKLKGLFAMALTAEAVIDAFWQSAEELADEVQPHHLQRLL
jgi:hypothetical protein